MDSTPTRRIPNDAQLGAVHTAGGPGMEATVEQEAGNLPKRAVQAQLRHEHDVGGRIRAQQPRPAQHLGPQQAELRVDVAHPLEQLLKPHAGPGGLQVQTVVVCRSDSPVRVDELGPGIRQHDRGVPIQNGDAARQELRSAHVISRVPSEVLTGGELERPLDVSRQPEVPLVADVADALIHRGIGPRDLARAVGRGVVADDELEVVVGLRQQ